MTRKHFADLAHNLASVRPPPGPSRETWTASVKAVAEVCAFYNPRFDRSKFMEACGK